MNIRTVSNALNPPTKLTFFHVAIMACFGKKFSAPTMASRMSHLILSRILTPASSYRAGKSRSSLQFNWIIELLFHFLAFVQTNVISSRFIPEIYTSCPFILVTLLHSTNTAAAVKWTDKRRIVIGWPSLNWELQWWQRRRPHGVAETEETVYGKLNDQQNIISLTFWSPQLFLQSFEPMNE